jgi:hypothetical protein
MEGIGGPAIIIFGMTNTITIKSNYIATTNEGRVTHEGMFPVRKDKTFLPHFRMKIYVYQDRLGTGA